MIATTPPRTNTRPRPMPLQRGVAQLTRQLDATAHTPTRKVILFPILFFQLYLTLTVFVFAFGPVPYVVQDPLLLYSFVLVSQFAVLIGYLIGANSRPCTYGRFIPIEQLLFLSVICSLIILIPTLRHRSSSDLSTVDALMDPGAAYHAKAELQSGADETNLGLSVPRVVLAPLLAVLLPVGIVHWEKMTSRFRIFWIAAIGGTLLSTLIIGTNKGVFEIALPLPWLVWLYGRRRSKLNLGAALVHRPHKSRFAYKACAAGVLFIGGAISYFIFTMYSRAAGYGVEYQGDTVGWSHRYGIELPLIMEYGIYQLCSYVSHGYYGLSECLQLPFEPCFGVGNSVFLSRRIGPLLGMGSEAALTISFPARLETQTGYSATVYWHSIYPWLASDLTFAGAIIFMGLMAFYFAQSWIDTLQGENPFAIMTFCMFLMMFLYIPANNTVFSYPEPLCAFLVNAGLWRFTRRASHGL